jgi:hypothetical protein
MSLIAQHLFDSKARERLERDIGEIVTICGMRMRVLIDPAMPPDQLRMTCGPNSVTVTGLSDQSNAGDT